MNIKCYTKQELALLYFPESTPEVANAHLRRWIVRCKPLHQRLIEMGYQKVSKVFTPKETACIFDFLGEP